MRIILIIVYVMKKYLVVLIALLLVLVGCSNSKDNQKSIAVSFYPVEYLTQRIVGDDFKVVNLTPIGSEPHGFELSPDSTQLLLDAKLAIVLGNDFQPAIEKTASSRDGKTINLIEASERKDEHALSAVNIGYRPTHGDADHDGEEHDQDHEGNDPHIWLDPVLMQEVVGQITDALVDLNPSESKTYMQRSDDLIADLKALDTEFKEGLKQCERRTFITSHDAFSRLAARYGLTQESIAGISPENEPSPARLNELKNLVNEKNISVIFTEELVSDKVAKTLSEEAAIQVKVLSPIEGLTQAQIDNDEDYFSLMRNNLSSLQVALGCSS